MKRHTCYKCKRKFYEDTLEKEVHEGKNKVAYFGWKCKDYCGSGYHRDKNWK